MVSSSHQAIACFLIIFGAAVLTYSQTTPAKEPTASISGKVTVKGKGAAKIVVAAMIPDFSAARILYRDTTDEEGNYRITKLPAGTYRLSAIAPAFVTDDEDTNKSVMISDGEIIDGINLALVRGGVITGRITDTDGQPLIEEYVNIISVDSSGSVRIFNGFNQTDDRGVYRLYGLREGKYKISVGQDVNQLPASGRQFYKQTFHPSVIDSAKATVIDVSEGSEAKNIDIVVGRPATTFTVSGRVVDGQTGKALPNIRYGVQQVHEHGGSSVSGSISNAEGEFRLENVLPGKYSVFIEPPANSDMRAKPLPFEVIDRDLSGLVIRTSTGASLSGVVVLEATDDKFIQAKLTEAHIYAAREDSSPNSMRSGFPVAVDADGKFHLRGLPSGVFRLDFVWTNRSGSRQFSLVRVERDGVVQPGGIELKEGEHISGLRVVAKYLNGTIRGTVKIASGELPAGARISVWVNQVDYSGAKSERRSISAPEVDARGRFVIEGLPGGTYEVNVALVMPPGRRGSSALAKQQVIVPENGVSEMTISLDLKSNLSNP